MSQFQDQVLQIHQNMQIGSGLTRYKSAPSSYIDTFLNGDDDFEQLLNPRLCSPETQRIFARFMNSGVNIQENCSTNMNLPSESQLNPQILAPRKKDDEPVVKKPRQQLQRQQSHDFGSVSQVKMPSHSLVRHSSSPVGLFESINIEEIGAARGIGNFGAGNVANPQALFSSASRFKNKTDLPPRNPSSGSKGISENKPKDGQCNEECGNEVPGFPLNQWDDSILSDDFFKGLAEDDVKPFPIANASADQKNEGGNRTTTRMTHHLSLPKSCSAMEKLVEDSVPCKLRAKRGFATHPRSIAERVRRTKISERIKKLQEFVPNMDKQTNTADMLDMAVDYIKDLQRQVKMLSDNGAKCGCSPKK